MNIGSNDGQMRMRLSGVGVEQFDALFDRLKVDRKLGRTTVKDGPTKWCRQCHRYHARRVVCDLFLRTRTLQRVTSSGVIVAKEVKRWAH